MTPDCTDITFRCSGCSQKLAVEAAGAGLTAHCPNCQSLVTVPLIGSMDERCRGERAAGLHGSRPASPGLGGRAGAKKQIAQIGGLNDSRGENAEHPAQSSVRQALRAAEEERDRLARNAQAEARSFQAERQQLKAELAAARQRMTAVELEREAAAQHAAEFEMALAAAEGLAQSLECEKAALLEASTHAAEISAERLLATETQLQVREQEIAALRLERHSAQRKMSTARAEIDTLQEESALLRDRVDRLQVEAEEGARIRQQLIAAEERLHAKEAEARVAEARGEELSGCCATLRAQTETLRRDLTETSTGRELIELRARLATSEQEHRQAKVLLAQTEAEAKSLAAAESKLRGERDAINRLRIGAEKRAEAVSDAQLRRDNDVLRGITARLNSELARQHAELLRLRRARLLLRLLQLLAAVAVAGIVALAIKILPEAVAF